MPAMTGPRIETHASAIFLHLMGCHSKVAIDLARQAHCHEDNKVEQDTGCFISAIM
jgi:hypothetical protein